MAIEAERAGATLGEPRPSSPSGTPRLSRLTSRRRGLGLLVALVALAGAVFASVAVGAKPVSPHAVLGALFAYDGSPDEAIVRGLRLPRTGLGITAGASLGVAGVLMQALTRNPLADPGILGVNAGASAGVVLAIAFGGFRSYSGYIGFALAGAALTTFAVYSIGRRGPVGATPTRLVLAGAAVSAALTALVSAVLLMRPQVFDAFRFWTVGALSGRQASTLWDTLPLLGAGLVVAALLARPLDALALGEETATALGTRVGWTRLMGAVSVTLLCGGATAAVGPISFVGLAVPHLARRCSGPQHLWIIAYAAVFAAALLLGADVLGRVLARPGELEVGVVTAFLGAPALIALSRRAR